MSSSITGATVDNQDNWLAALADTCDVSGFARERLLFDPDVHQQAVLECNARRVILNCSRQWGKSTVVAAKAVHAACTNPGALVIVASPTLKQSGEFIRKAKAFLLNQASFFTITITRKRVYHYKSVLGSMSMSAWEAGFAHE